jgi:hypothetical protein
LSLFFCSFFFCSIVVLLPRYMCMADVNPFLSPTPSSPFPSLPFPSWSPSGVNFYWLTRRMSTLLMLVLLVFVADRKSSRLV